MAAAHAGVHASGLGKRFGDLWALRDLHIDAAPGTVLGLLGHNGAGKTTAIRVLTTLARPTEGRATVAGYDVERFPALVRSNIGVASQQATVDGLLDARLNLELIGRLHRLSRTDARRRADELIERFALTDAADRLVKTFSGGMRRRIDLAACLVATPQVLFLDEPTTGLDPRSREDLWDMLRELVADGTTVILTTQYLEEADRLADDIVVLDHGRTVAHGSPEQLKRQIGDDRIIVTVALAEELSLAASVLSRFATGDLTMDARALTVTASTTSDTSLVEVVRALDANGVYVADLTRRQSTLDDVFLSLTESEHR
ncbi:ATP-binding cassette domain-containing protein [Desertimonas flava]|uniref:ATP-binding cassette domain-containing protein n=1 Tax=Desertimonas flava TaxID=2064846 RepID=UPI000E350239|nr:ATP-binding cassette domain-containing protein [Desertimonas flava]